MGAAGLQLVPGLVESRKAKTTESGEYLIKHITENQTARKPVERKGTEVALIHKIV